MKYTEGFCLVTGGAGFIGSALSSQLATRFSKVVAVDNLHYQVHTSSNRPAMLAPSVELVKEDICLPETWARLLQDGGPDVVIHLAAETGTGQSLTEASRHGMVNVVGTTQMLDAFARRGLVPRHIVLTSSRAVYGEGAWRSDIENTPFYPGQRSHQQLKRKQWDFPGASPLPLCAGTTQPRPTNIYAATKLTQEHIINVWALAFGTRATTLRLQNVYGPGQSLTNSYTGIVALFSRQANAGHPIELYEDGMVTRDFVYIEDVVTAVLAAIDRKPAQSYDATPIDIGSGESTTLLQLAAIIAHVYGAPTPVVVGRFRDGDVRHATCDIRRAAELLHYHPAWSLEAGIRALRYRLMEHFNENACN